MSGTYATLSASGGVGLPQPNVRIVKGSDHPSVSGDHDRLWAGGMTKPQFDAIAEMNPEIWLFRYKRGFHPKSNPHYGYGYDNTRGYVHPSHYDGVVTNIVNYSGGAHNSRNGNPVQARPTEWVLTDDNRYGAVFKPELWFHDRNTKPYTWPIQPIATATGDEHLNIGYSGHSGNNTGSYPDQTAPGFCNSAQTSGTQRQWFAFAYVVQDADDPRNHIIGPFSEVIRASIWPVVKVNYGACLPQHDRGRKIRLQHL